jgi:hypothetical protein
LTDEPLKRPKKRKTDTIPNRLENPCFVVWDDRAQIPGRKLPHTVHELRVRRQCSQPRNYHVDESAFELGREMVRS